MKKNILFIFLLLLSGFCWSADLEVLSVSPKGSVGTVTDALNIVVTFNEPMVALKATPEGPGSGPLRIEPGMSGKFRWMGARTLVFIPADTLPLASSFKITIPAGTASLNGAVLSEAYSWEFETARPAVLFTYPESEEGGFDPKGTIFLRFNQEMDLNRVEKKISLIGGAGTNPIRVRMATQAEIQAHWRLGDDTTKVLAVSSLKPLLPGTDYTLVLAQGLPGKQGTLGLLESRRIEFTTVGDFTFQGVNSNQMDESGALQPNGGIRFSFSNRITAAELVKHLKFEPDVEIPEYYADRTWPQTSVYLGLDFQPETLYRYTIDNLMTDIYGNRLRSVITGTFKTCGYPPYVAMNTGPGVLEAYGDRRYPVYFVNQDRVGVRMGLIPPDRLIPLLRSPEDIYGRSTPLPDSLFFVNRSWQITAPRNTKSAQPLQVDWLLAGRKTGVVLAEVDDLNADENPVQYKRILLQVTNLGVSAKFSPINNLIWVTNLQDATPVAGAKVEIRDDQNRKLWSGTTTAAGLVQSPGWRELGLSSVDSWERPRQWVFVYKDMDFAYTASDWGTGIYPYRFDIDYEWNPEPVKHGGTLFTDRGLYRAGETVQIKGLLRERRFHDWSIPLDKDYVLKINDSRGNTLVDEAIRISEYGSFDYTLPLSSSAPLGYYYMRVVTPSDSSGAEGETYMGTSFRVEAFRPAEFNVRLQSAAPSYVVGDSARVFVSANYLFGAPMSGQKVNWHAYLDRGSFRPEGHEGYLFGNDAWDWEDNERFTGRTLAQQKSILDGQGSAHFGAAVQAPGVDFPLQLTVSADVSSPSRQVIGSSERITIHPASFYIGLKPATTFAEVARPLSFQVITVAPDGADAPGKQVKVKLIKRQWHSVRKAGIGGRYEWLSKPVDTTADSMMVQTGGEPVQGSFTPKEAGVYYLVAEGKEKMGRQAMTQVYLYVIGKGYVAWMREDDDIIELIRNKDKYKPGDVARVMVKSPFETASALVTLEREGVLSQQVLTLEGSTPTIDIPITKKHLPNVYVSIILLKGRSQNFIFSEEGEDVGRPAFKIGYVNLPVDAGSQHLQVTVKSDMSNYQPGGKVTISIDVKDADGEPSPAEVTLAVVDRGVLNLINYELPDPFDDFYGIRPLSVQTSETRLHVVEQRNYGEKGEKRGGGGAEGFGGDLDLRKNFKATAYWAPKLEIDETGHATVTFKLPDNLTTFKIMAVAHTIASEFGAGSSEIKVNQPLMLLAALPRFARLGDAFEAGAVVHNLSGQNAQATLTLDVQGLDLLESSSKSFSLQNGESKEIRYKFKAAQTGTATFQFRCQMAGFSDGLQRTIPVQSPSIRETVALYQRAEKSSQQQLEIPAEVYPELSQLEVSLASTALSELSEPMHYLMYYPYECLEQRLSRVLPVIVSQDLVEAFAMKVAGVQDYRGIVTKGLAELGRFRTDEGGFAVWPGSYHTSPFGTAYAALTMTLAQQNGFEVDQEMLEGSLDYINNVLNQSYYYDVPYSETSWRTTRAMMLYVMALNDRADTGVLDQLVNGKEPMTVLGRAYLLKTLHLTRANDAQMTLVRQALLNKIRVSPTEAHFEEADASPWIYDSDVRTTAVVLQAFLETGSVLPQAEQVVAWLMSQRKQGRWENTQENFYVLYALNEYLKKVEKEVPQFTARVRLAGQEMMSKVFAGRSVQVEKRTITLQPSQKKQLQVDFEKEGTGMLYYGMRMTYFPLDVSEPRDEGITVVKIVEPVSGGKATAEKIPAGDLVKITLNVIVTQDCHYVVVDDPIPAGLEAVNVSLASTSAAVAQMGESDEENPWWFGFTHVEKHDDRVLLFGDWLATGVHTYSYLARATTKGTFTLPPTHAEQMYKPEVYGRTTSGKVRVE